MIHMHRELDDRNRVLVGLIIIFALLFFCAYGAWLDRESSVFWTTYIEEPEVQEVVKEEPHFLERQNLASLVVAPLSALAEVLAFPLPAWFMPRVINCPGLSRD